MGTILTRMGLGAAGVGALLAFSTAFADPFYIPRFAAVSLGAALAWAGLAADEAAGRPKVRQGPLDAPIAAFLGALLLSTCFSIDPALSVTGRHENFYGLWPAALLASLFFAASWHGREEPPAVLVRILLAAGLALAGAGFYQKFVSGTGPGGAALPHGRLISLSGTPNFLGSNLLLLFPPALVLALSRPRADRIFGVVCAAAFGAAVFLTLSRGALLGLAAGISVFLALRAHPNNRLSLRFPRAGKAGLLAAGAALGAAAVLGVGALRDLRSSPDSIRAQAWAAGARAFLSAPVLGTGPDTLKLAALRQRTPRMLEVVGTAESPADAHNDLLQLAATTGIAGLGAYLALLLAAVIAVRRSIADPKRRDWAAAFAGALAGLFVAAKFNPTPFSSLVLAALWGGLALPPAAGRLPRAELRRGIAGAVCAAVFLGAVFSIRFLAAARAQHEARAADGRGEPKEAARHFARAMSLNPWRIEYKEDYVRYLAKWIPWAGSDRQKGDMHRLGELAARDAIRRHPLDARGHHMLGFVLWNEHRLTGSGRLAEAAAALDEASRLNPYYPPILELRARVRAATSSVEP